MIPQQFSTLKKISAVASQCIDHSTYIEKLQTALNTDHAIQYEEINLEHAIDKIIAIKEVSATNTRHLLRATTAIELESTDPVFYIMLFNQDIEGSGEAIIDILPAIKLSDPDLLQKSHEAIKKTKVMFDTKNYCHSLQAFLTLLQAFDKDLFKAATTLKTVN